MEQDSKQDIITNTMTNKTKKNNRGLIVGMSICAILAIGGIGFGTYGMILVTTIIIMFILRRFILLIPAR